MFDRLILQEDILIEETGGTQTIRIGPWPFFADITIDENDKFKLFQGNVFANVHGDAPFLKIFIE